MTAARKPIATCVVCEDDLYEAPTARGWARLTYGKGLCWECTESFHRSMRRCLEAMGRVDEATAEERARQKGKPTMRTMLFHRTKDDGGELAYVCAGQVTRFAPLLISEGTALYLLNGDIIHVTEDVDAVDKSITDEGDGRLCYVAQSHPAVSQTEVIGVFGTLLRAQRLCHRRAGVTEEGWTFSDAHGKCWFFMGGRYTVSEHQIEP